MIRFFMTLAAVLTAAAPDADTPIWPDTPPARLAALAVIQSLELRLLTEDSATLVLDDWCAAHHLAAPGETILAQRVFGATENPPADLRARLGVGPRTQIAFRHVRLVCGDRILSEADNWYVPARLTPAMNRTLNATDQPFGRVVKPLRFARRTLSAKLLWAPLPAGWDRGAAVSAGGGTLAIPDFVIENRAFLSVPGGHPFSLVVERYTSGVLAFPMPKVAGKT